jgi:hypothetical protein
MEIISVKAAERFDNVALDNVVDWWSLRARSMFTIYTCLQCKEKIQFQRSDFEKVWKRRNWTNLPQEVARCFDEFASVHGLDLKFLDWQCPRCSRAARVLIEQWAGGRHRDHGVNLVTVIEAII